MEKNVCSEQFCNEKEHKGYRRSQDKIGKEVF